ncbi:MAG: hypothetical protein AAB352_01300 [Patescibacteria group bacterium]
MGWFKIKLLPIRLLFYKLFGRNYIASICGHKTKLFSPVEIFGEKIFITLKRKFEYCPECLAKMSIRCAWCGKSILVGDPITLNTPVRKDWQVPDYAVKYKKDPLQLVGCLRWECADSGIDRAGFWMPPGKVYRVASPMEMVLATNDVAICNDITDISKAVPLPAQD